MQRVGDLCSLNGLGLSEPARVMDVDEIKARIRACWRLLAAWPTARVLDPDLTLLEYVNATRGVATELLPRLIDDVIAAGGEFLPPAGTLIERVARYRVARSAPAYNAHVSGEQRAAEAVKRALRLARRDLEAVEPIAVDAVARALPRGQTPAQIAAGRR